MFADHDVKPAEARGQATCVVIGEGGRGHAPRSVRKKSKRIDWGGNLRDGGAVEWTGARYADKPTVEVPIEIDAPPERVWAIVSDIETMPGASPELQAVEWLDGR
ncbi:MAG TPA: SRPBCC family protein, partial [Streptosporangiaceae bacterium]|nr:SRPBCC family protein [Streptosporangiaceae bacterium]